MCAQNVRRLDFVPLPCVLHPPEKRSPITPGTGQCMAIGTEVERKDMSIVTGQDVPGMHGQSRAPVTASAEIGQLPQANPAVNAGAGQNRPPLAGLALHDPAHRREHARPGLLDMVRVELECLAHLLHPGVLERQRLEGAS